MVSPEAMRRRITSLDDDHAEVIAVVAYIQHELSGTGLSIGCPRPECSNSGIEIESWDTRRTFSPSNVNTKESVLEILTSAASLNIPVETILREFLSMYDEVDELVVTGFDVPAQPASAEYYVRCTVCEEETRNPDMLLKNMQIEVPVLREGDDSEIARAYDRLRGTKLRDLFEFDG